MTQEEKAARIAILTRMLLGHPGEVQEDGLRWMLEVTAVVPFGLLERACLLASSRQLETAFAPGPGQILKAAVDCSPKDEYSPNVGTLKPKWFRVGMGRIKRGERPMEANPRVGAGQASEGIARLLSSKNEGAEEAARDQSDAGPVRLSSRDRD